MKKKKMSTCIALSTTLVMLTSTVVLAEDTSQPVITNPVDGSSSNTDTGTSTSPVTPPTGTDIGSNGDTGTSTDTGTVTSPIDVTTPSTDTGTSPVTPPTETDTGSSTDTGTNVGTGTNTGTEVTTPSKTDTATHPKPSGETPKPSETATPVIINPVETPITLTGGLTVIGTQDGGVLVSDDSGQETLKTPEELGGKVRSDGLVEVTDATNEVKVLPHTGENDSKSVVLFALVFIASVALLVKEQIMSFFARFKKEKG